MNIFFRILKMVDTENLHLASKPKTNIKTKKITKVGRKTKLNSSASFTIVYKKLAAVKAPTERNVDVGKTYTQTMQCVGMVMFFVMSGMPFISIHTRLAKVNYFLFILKRKGSWFL